MDTQSQFRALIEGRAENPDPEELARARAVLERMLVSDPGEARLYYYLGMVLFRQEEWEAAAEKFALAKGLDPQCPEYDIWLKKAENQSRRSPLDRYRGRLRRLCSQIGQEVLFSDVPDMGLPETLQEKINLARELQQRIALLPSAENSVSSRPARTEDESPPTPSTVTAEPATAPQIQPMLESVISTIEKGGKSPAKQKALLSIKKELESLHQLISSKARKSGASPVPTEEGPVGPQSDMACERRERYREELEALDSFEKLQLRQLFADIESKIPQVRSLAVDRLGEKNLGAVNPVLLKTWSEESVPEIQLKIVSILVRQGYTPLVPIARQVLEEERVNWALSAMEALYRLDWQTNISYLQKALRSKVPVIKKRAVTYIGWIKDYSSIPELVRLLRDPDAYVRKSVISALGSLKVKRSVHFLIEVLMDPVPGVRTYAHKTLKKLIGETFDYDPEANFIRRKESVEHLSAWWEAAEEEFSLADKSIKTSGTHLFSMKLTADPASDAVIEEKILSALRKSGDGADLLEIGQRIGVPWQRLVHKIEQLREEGKLEKTERKFALARNLE